MKRFLRLVAIFSALVGVGILSAFAVVALLLQQEEVRVPDLVGQDIVSVIETVRQQGLELRVERRESNPVVPRDAVISQSPPVGSAIKKGRQVRVILSQGPGGKLALKLIGEPYQNADIMIRQAGFSPGVVSRVSSEKAERDIVIAQSPPPDTPMDAGGRISLLVSTGKKSPVFVMPMLVEKKPEAALKLLEEVGLKHRISYKAGLDKAGHREPSVIDQKPEAGLPVRRDMTVDIVVSK